MKKRKKRVQRTRDLWMIRPAYVLLMIITAAQTVLLYFSRERLAYFLLPIVLFLIGYCTYRLLDMQQDIYRSVRQADKEMEKRAGHLIRFPMPALIINEKEEIIWYNETFRKETLDGHDIFFKVRFQML